MKGKCCFYNEHKKVKCDKGHFGSLKCHNVNPNCPDYNAGTDGLYCHVCGSTDLAFEGLAEGYSCPSCGSSDQDE